MVNQAELRLEETFILSERYTEGYASLEGSRSAQIGTYCKRAV